MTAGIARCRRTQTPPGNISAFQAQEAEAGPIIWGNATTIAADTDVLTAGNWVYGYNESNTATFTLNGVTFTQGNSNSNLGSGNITMAFSGGGTNTTTFGSGSGAAYNALSAAYKNLIKGAAYGSADAATINLNNLTAGHRYATQFWVHDGRTTGSGRTETITGGGGNTVTLDYNSTNAAGGVGQHTTAWPTPRRRHSPSKAAHPRR